MTMERMKLTKGFFDTETNLEYSAGDMYPRYVEPTAERIAFLKDAGVFGPTEEEFAQMPAVPTDKNTVDEIREYLAANDIAVPATVTKKADLLALLAESTTVAEANSTTEEAE